MSDLRGGWLVMREREREERVQRRENLRYPHFYPRYFWKQPNKCVNLEEYVFVILQPDTLGREIIHLS